MGLRHGFKMDGSTAHKSVSPLHKRDDLESIAIEACEALAWPQIYVFFWLGLQSLHLEHGIFGPYR